MSYGCFQIGRVGYDSAAQLGDESSASEHRFNTYACALGSLYIEFKAYKNLWKDKKTK